MNILTFSTLYPSAARPQHGIFVETRLRKLVESGAVSARVVAPCPWFPFASERFGGYAVFARTPEKETRHGLEVEHPRYPLPPKIGMSAAPLALFFGDPAVVAPAVASGARVRPDRRPLLLPRRCRRGAARTGSQPPGRGHRPRQRPQFDRPLCDTAPLDPLGGAAGGRLDRRFQRAATADGRNRDRCRARAGIAQRG